MKIRNNRHVSINRRLTFARNERLANAHGQTNRFAVDSADFIGMELLLNFAIFPP